MCVGIIIKILSSLNLSPYSLNATSASLEKGIQHKDKSVNCGALSNMTTSTFHFFWTNARIVHSMHHPHKQKHLKRLLFSLSKPMDTWCYEAIVNIPLLWWSDTMQIICHGGTLLSNGGESDLKLWWKCNNETKMSSSLFGWENKYFQWLQGEMASSS